MRREIAASLSALEAELERIARVLAAPEFASDGQFRSVRPKVAEAHGLVRQAIGRLSAAAEALESDRPASADSSATAVSPRQQPLADRLVALGPTATDAFRTRVKLKTPAATAPEPPSAATQDDLTRIRGIDRALAARLGELGITSFAEIAGWDHDEVKRVAAALDLGRQISRQNWIEQAALLRGPTVVAPPKPTLPQPVAKPPHALAVVEVAAEPEPEPEPPAAEPSADALVLIRGIDPAIAIALASGGVTRWAEIAAWREADVARWSQTLGAAARISKDCWIEQSALLAGGASTAYAVRSQNGEFASLVARPADETLPPPQFVDWQQLRAETELPAPTPHEPAPTPVVADEFSDMPVAANDDGAALSPAGEIADGGADLVEGAPIPGDDTGAAADMPLERPQVPRLNGLGSLGRALAEQAANANDAEVPEQAAVVEADRPAQSTAMAPDIRFEPRAEAAPIAPALITESEVQITTRPAPVVVGAPLPSKPPMQRVHIEDEEFAELTVDEAEVMIVPRSPVAPHPATGVTSSRPLSTSARSLISRLRRTAALDEIDPGTYAAYHDRVEEAAVEIVKPGQKRPD